MTRPLEIVGPTGQPWNTAWGVVGTPVMVTTFSQAVTSATGIDLTTGTTLASTWNAVPNRRYKMTASGLIIQQSVSAGTSKVFIVDAANAILGLLADAQLAASAFGSRCTVGGVYCNPASLAVGSTTWHLRAQASAGTATVSNDSACQVLVQVEDIGPF